MTRLVPALAALWLAWCPLGAWAQSAPATESGPPPLIVPFPGQMTERDIFGLDSMHYSIIRNGNRNVLFVFGGIAAGDSVRFRNALDAARPVDEIVLYSPGGNLGEGLEIGRLIHARKLATHILRGMSCVSACNFVFMGGVVRYVDQGASFKVHMFSDHSADLFRRDLVGPPRTYEQLLRKYPVIDPDDIVRAIHAVFPAFLFDGQKFRAARSTVIQQNRIDTTDPTVVNLEALRSLVADFNHDHPDKPVVDEAVILNVVMAQDVKLIQMDSAETAAEIARYLTEMSLSLKFLTRFAAIHNDQPTDLTRNELREFNVINTD